MPSFEQSSPCCPPGGIRPQSRDRWSRTPGRDQRSRLCESANARAAHRLAGPPVDPYHQRMALLALREVSLGFRGPVVLEGVNLTLDPAERVCLLGRNASGKSTLLRLIHGEIEPDRGE